VLKQDETQIIDRYEKILTRELLGDSAPTNLMPQENMTVQGNPKERQIQMNQMVQRGLQIIDKETKLKRSRKKDANPLFCRERDRGGR
jgi:hypothetical protein